MTPTQHKQLVIVLANAASALTYSKPVLSSNFTLRRHNQAIRLIKEAQHTFRANKQLTVSEVVNIANETHVAMPPTADDHDEMIAIVKAVLAELNITLLEK